MESPPSARLRSAPWSWRLAWVKPALLIPLLSSILSTETLVRADTEANPQEPVGEGAAPGAPTAPGESPAPEKKGNPAPAATEKWLAQIQEEFQTLHRSRVEQPFEDGIQALQKRYLKLLQGLLTARNATEEQEEMDRRRQEAANFIARDRTIPDEDHDTRSESIKTWRAEFRGKVVLLQKERAERLGNLQAHCDEILAKNEEALVQRDRPEEADLVKGAREKLLADWLRPAGKKPVEADVAEGEPWEGETPEEWERSRAAMIRSVRWLLAIGAELRIKGTKGDRALTAPEQLPSGRPRFSLVAMDQSTLKAELGESDLDRLAPLRGASKLILRQIDVGDRALRFLEEWKGLAELTLEGGHFTDELIPRLEHFNTLRRLTIRSAPHITAQTAGCLTHMDRLEAVNLAHSGITDAGAAALSTLRHVTSLDVSYTPIKDAGVAHLATMRSLRSLRLDQCGFTDEGLRQISKLRKIEQLSLSGTRVTDEGIVYLANLDELESLDLSRLEITGEGFDHFFELHKLTRLNLSATKLTDSGIEHLSRVHSLRFMDIRNTQVSASGVASLAPLRQLERLDFLSSSRPGFAEAVQSIVKNLSQLEFLEITGPEVGAEQIENLADMRNLKSLSLPSVKLGPGAADALGKITDLQTLLLPRGNFSDSEIEGLLRLRNLSRLDLSGTAITDEGLTKIREMKSLRELHVSQTAVTRKAELEAEKWAPELRIVR